MDIEAELDLHEIMVCGEHAVLITTNSNLRMYLFLSCTLHVNLMIVDDEDRSGVYLRKRHSESCKNR